MSLKPLSLNELKEAHEFLKPHIFTTPIKKSFGLPGVYYKCENLQKTGSFKIRGALNKIRQLSDQEKAAGVIAASAGNHAQGVAYSSQHFGVHATIVMPLMAPLTKVERTKGYGAEVLLHGDYFDESFEKAMELSQSQNKTFVHPYKDSQVIAGQGTIGLEIMESFKDVEQIIVPVGGGGLISGIALAVKNLKPSVEVVGVVSNQTPGMMGFKENTSMSSANTINTIADGIAVKNPSKEMFDLFINQHVDQMVSVSDSDIADAIVNVLENDKLVLEGSGAAGVAALLSGKVAAKKNCCVLLCGGNIDLNMVQTILETGLRRRGRLTRISVVVDDLPGSLASLTQLMAESRANVLDVVHDRTSFDLSLRETRIDFLLETTGEDHIKRLRQTIKERGIFVLPK